MAETLNLYQKLLKITEEIGTIEKTGRNSTQGYAFIEQAQIVAELRPQLAKYGVLILPETVGRTIERYDVTRGNGKAGVDIHANVTSRYTVINADNPDERFTCDWDGGEAIDSGDKATNKAVTASHKYFLMKLFNISDKDDADSDSPTAPAGPAVKPQSRPTYNNQPSSSYVSESQIKLLLARTRDWYEVEHGVNDVDRATVLAAFTEKFGVEPNKVLKADVDEILSDLSTEAKS